MTVTLLIVVFLVLVTIGMPVAFALIASSAVAVLNDGLPSMLVAQQSFIIVNSYTLMAIPFYIVAGELMGVCGLTQRIVDFSNAMIGHFRGGLAQVNIVGCTIFSGLSGSAVADTAAVGSVLIPAMLKEGYSRKFAIAVTCSAGCLGPIIPPSIFMIVYGALTGVSIAKLFLAGIIPGLLIAASMMLLCYYYSFHGEGGISHPRASWPEIRRATFRAGPALILPVIILGGILFGVFTPTEAGIVAVIYTFLFGIFSGNLTFKNLWDVFFVAIYRSSQVLFMTAAAGAYAWLLARNDFGENLATALLSVGENRILLLIVIVIGLTVISTFLDSLAAVLILVPVLYPLGLSLGYDPIHFALILLITIVYGGITPPVAPVLYVASAIAGGGANEAVKATIPFLGVMYLVVMLMIIFPQIVTVLPNAFGP